MRRIFTLPLLLLLVFIIKTSGVKAQNCAPTGINGTIVNLSCSQTCTNMRFQVPHLKSTSTYAVNTIPYAPLSYIVAGGTEDASLYDDDTYSGKFTLPFPFCFYDSTYYKAVIGSNGLVTFDTLNAGCSNAYTMANTIPYAGGSRCAGISPDYYPKASIMGYFTDIDPTDTQSPSDRKIQWHVEGTAPCRKFVVSYYHVGTFGDQCGLSVDSSNTFQMVMYESTGLIDVYILNKSCFSSTNFPGYAILGVQNWNQNKAVAAPGKNLTIWTAHNEGYRFTPNGGASRFVSSGLYTLGGALVAPADTATTTVGLLDISFPNICPGVTTKYVIRTIFNACPLGTQLISYDTITIVHINTLTASSTTTPSTCGVSVGTITATVTGGVGTPPFTYTITPPPSAGPATNSTGIFTGLAAGPYSISIADANSCPVTITQTVAAISSLAGTAATTGTACTGVNNGIITLTPQGNGPYTFTLTGPGGPYVQTSPVFTNLNSGTYNVTYVDVNNCNGTISNIIVASGGTLSGSSTHTNTTCSGANDGTITVTPSVPNSYSYTLNPGAVVNTTGIFSGLAATTYSVTFTNIATGCSGTVTGITISVGSTIPATWIRTNETCPGVHDGTIQINPSAAGSYTYTLTPGAITNTTGLFTGLSAGIFFNVTFTNLTSGCGGSMTNLFVQAASTISGTAAHTNSTCPNVNDGTITITPSPAAGSYSYTLTPGPVTNPTGVFTGLAPGTYSVAFQNPGGCGSSVSNIVITTGAGATATSTHTDASCNGINDGTITVNPPATGGPFTYTLNPGAVINTTGIFTGLAPNTYTITFGSAGGGCGGIVSPNPVVGAGAAPTATATHTDATCTGVNNGTITITPPSTGGPFIYTVNPGNIVHNNNPVFTNLPTGTYTITFTNAAGCIGTVPNQVVASGSNPTTTATGSVTTCPGVSNGTVTVTPPASGGPFTYTLNPGAVTNSTGIFNGLAPGSYTMTFTNAAGCVGTVPVNPVVTSGPTPTTTATHTNITCLGADNGTVTVTAPSIGGPFIYTLNPGNIVQNNNPVFNGLIAGVYTVTFTNSQGCSGTVSGNMTVLEGSVPTTPAIHANTTCAGSIDGTITVTPPSANGPFTYTLNPGAVTNTTGIFTGLAAVPYTVTFTNALGCSGTVTGNTTVLNGPVPSTTAVRVNTTCPGADDGTITVTPPATGGPFTYTLNPGAVSNTTGIFTGLTPNTYTITFVNSLGCSGTVTGNTTIANGGAPTATAVHVNTTCPGAGDGTITITPPATGAPFIYTLNPGNIVQNNNPVFIGLTPAAYTITFVNTFGCAGTVTGNTTIVNGGAPTASSVSTNTTCSQVSDGTITVTPPATGAPFVYTLNPGSISNNTGVFSGLPAGTYTLTFINSFGCSGTVTGNSTITNGAAPTATAVPSRTTCAQVDDGTITVTPPIAGGPFIYTLNPGNIVHNNNPVFTGLAAGSYTITFTNALGCVGNVPGSIVVGTGVAPVATAVPTGTTCPGVSNGVITVTPPATGGPFIYSLNPGNIVHNDNPVYTGLAAGSYTITFTNALGCVGNVAGSIVVGTGAAPVATAVPTSTTCPGVSNGVITVTPPATGGPFIYTLNPGNIIHNDNPVFTGLAPATYTITFTTALGCIGSVPGNIVLQDGAPLAGTATPVNPPCANINDGTITLNPSISAVYTYVLNPGLPGEITQPNNPLFTGLAPGIYTYNFTNAVGCIGSGTVTLTTHAPLAVSVSYTKPLCNGGADGAISLSASGGVSPYQYSLAPFTTYQAGTFNGLAAGVYTFRIRDNAGCTKDTTVSLTQPTALNASASSTPGTCNGNDGSITVAGSGGTPAYTYSIDNGTNYQSTGAFTVSGGAYPNIKVKDGNGCVASTSVNVVLTDNMSALFIGNDTTICAEQSITFQPQVSPQATIFLWSTRPDPSQTKTLTDINIKNPTATPLDTTTYILNATWGVCTRTDSIKVSVLHKPVPYAGRDTAICYGDSIAVIYGSASNVSGTVNYEWSDTAHIATPHAQTSTVNIPATETFTLTVTDNYGCNFSVTDQVIVKVQPPVPAFAGNDTIAVLGQPHQMLASGGVSYTWEPSAPLNIATIANPLATLTHDQLFTVIVTDEAGCVGSDHVFVQVYDGPTYYVPNAFSPNGDGLNDIFRVVPPGISYTQSFRIFNRFGEMVFETNQWLKGWDGTFQGKKQPIGSYVWVIRGVNKFGKTVDMKGTVMLVR